MDKKRNKNSIIASPETFYEATKEDLDILDRFRKYRQGLGGTAVTADMRKTRDVASRNSEEVAKSAEASVASEPRTAAKPELEVSSEEERKIELLKRHEDESDEAYTSRFLALAEDRGWVGATWGMTDKGIVYPGVLGVRPATDKTPLMLRLGLVNSREGGASDREVALEDVKKGLMSMMSKKRPGVIKPDYFLPASEDSETGMISKLSDTKNDSGDDTLETSQAKAGKDPNKITDEIGVDSQPDRTKPSAELEASNTETDPVVRDVGVIEYAREPGRVSEDVSLKMEKVAKVGLAIEKLHLRAKAGKDPNKITDEIGVDSQPDRTKPSAELEASNTETDPVVRDVGVIEYAREPGRVSEDVSLVDSDLGIYAVIDGVGGLSSGRLAAEAAKKGTYDYIATERIKNLNKPTEVHHIKSELVKLHSAVKKEMSDKLEGSNANAVGTVVTSHEIEGKKYLGVLHAGDTRMFIRSNDGSIRSIVTDQSKGNVVHNSLRDMKLTGDSGDVLAEMHIVEVTDGDRILLCSDGITGDWEDQFLSDEEMKRGFAPKTAKESAEEFYKISKKSDDKTAVVLDI